MNIFVLSLDPKKAAKFHCNKHVVKMILEYTQLLFTLVHWLNPLLLNSVVDKEGYPLKVYKETHVNHPCSIWLRKSKSNVVWLVDLLEACCEVYTYRYHKTHKCEVYLHFFKTVLIPYSIQPDLGLTEFAVAITNKELKIGNNSSELARYSGCEIEQVPEEWEYNTVASYRNYIKQEKAYFAVWFDGNKKKVFPKWFKTWQSRDGPAGVGQN